MTPENAHHFFVLAILTLAAVVLIVAIRSFGTVRASRRQTSALGELQSDLGDIKARLASVEHLLREVG